MKLLDPTNADAAFKLSVCYLYKKDCKQAWTERDRCKAHGGTGLTPEFEALLARECPR
ncbi:MAG: hypothetical protein R2818_04745 [Flavobacteriales bacterium]